MTRPCAARCSSTGSMLGLPGLAGDLEDGAEPVGLGLVRADDPEVAVRLVGRHHVAQPAAQHPGRLGQVAPGSVTLTAYVAEVGQLQVAGRAGRRWRAGWRPSAGRRSAASPTTSAAGAPVGVEELLGPVGAHPVLQLRPGAPASSRAADSGTWWARQVPSTGTPSTSFGPVQPFGVRSTIIGQWTARWRRRRGRPLDLGDRGRRPSSSVAASSWCTVGRVVARRPGTGW